MSHAPFQCWAENRAVWGALQPDLCSPPLNKGGFTDAKACI
jgi:hypothetical protein